ncbi:pyridoxal-phosphate dependent enzyme [Actinoplanes sp. NPDC026670]|uniref:pyridoxal-phosphate dependent enzyme n=1 Tax=Actinoplanes sp. NPDC026670 TaxID=3154700 RepID=UPI00340CE074
MIRDSVVDCVGGTPLVRLARLFPEPGVEVIAKLEALNPSGDGTDRAARHIIEQGLRDGLFTADTRLVESVGGDAGVGIAMVARICGLRLTAVVDSTVAAADVAVMRLLGATVDTVAGDDDPAGNARRRLDRVQEILRADPHSRWIDQTANALNVDAHFRTTAREIADAVGDRLDVLVAAVRTGGTLTGAARRLRAEFPALSVVAVDMVGSTVFGGPPGANRWRPAGGGPRPQLLEPAGIDRVVHVTEAQTVAACRRLLQTEAILAGPASGAVVAALDRILPLLTRPVRVAAVLPDRGDRHLHDIFAPAGPETPRPGRQSP